MNDNATTIETATMAADRDEALIAFLDADSGADLTAWASRYPESGPDLVRVAAARWAGDTIAAPSPDAADIRAIGLETLAAFRATRHAATAPAASPLTDLLRAAKVRGLTPPALAARVRIPFALCVKLHRRLIAPDSIPTTVVREMAEVLGRRMDEISAYFRLPPTLAMGASYRADSTPAVAAQESFADALSADPQATDEHRAFHGAG